METGSQERGVALVLALLVIAVLTALSIAYSLATMAEVQALQRLDATGDSRLPRGGSGCQSAEC